MNRAFRKRPPFLFPGDAWMANLPCDPCIKARGYHPTHYPEFFMFPGPLVIGDPGSNTLVDLIGRTYAFLFCDDWTWYLLRWVGDEHLAAEGLESRGWEVITDLLPPLPEFIGVERRFSASFDQSARLNVAYEINGVVKVTRWDPNENQYMSNVNFEGVDPCVVFDATWAYDVPVSDVIVFYLSSDRERLMARVQRDMYLIEYELHDYEQAVVLDRVVRLPLRYMVLASDAAGEPLSHEVERQALISGLYPYPYLTEMAGAAYTPSAGDYELVVYTFDEFTDLDTTVFTPTGGLYVPPIIEREDDDAIIGVAYAPTGGAYVSVLIEREDEAGVDVAAFTPTGGLYTLVILTTASGEAITGAPFTPTGGTYEQP